MASIFANVTGSDLKRREENGDGQKPRGHVLTVLCETDRNCPL